MSNYVFIQINLFLHTCKTLPNAKVPSTATVQLQRVLCGISRQKYRKSFTTAIIIDNSETQPDNSYTSGAVKHRNYTFC